eukprot:373159_1
MAALAVCKYGCGHTVTPGKTKRGRAYDTCCRACAKSNGSKHDRHCIARNPGKNHHANSSIPKWKLRRNKPVHGAKTMTLYHITNKAGVDGIQSSDKMLRGGAGMFGGGIYFAESVDIAKSKAHYSGYVITAKVLVGKELQVNNSSAGNFTFRELWKKGYDSVWAPKGSGCGQCERVIYNSDQVEIINVKSL